MLKHKFSLLFFFALGPVTNLPADMIIEEFRHITFDGSDFRFYGCNSCTHSGFSGLPTGATYGGLTPPHGSATYTSNSSFSSDPFALSGRASLAVNVDDSSIPMGASESWNRAEMHVEVSASYVDTAFVEGVPNGLTGTVAIGWVLTGDQLLKLDTQNNIGVNTVAVATLGTSAKLSAADSMGLPPATSLDVENSYPGSGGGFPLPESANELFTQNKVNGSDVVIFPGVPFTQGTAVALNFELLLTADLEILNADALKFSAELDAEFSNTATIAFAQVFDSNGDLIEGATLNSSTFGVYPSSAIPEPSAFFCLAICLGAVLAKRRFAANNKEQA